MKPGSLLLALGSLVLWAPPLLLLAAPLKSRCLLTCQSDEDCPAGHACASFRGRLLCRPVAAAAAAGVPGTLSPIHGSDTGMPEISGAHEGKDTSKPPLPGVSPKDMQLTQCRPGPKGPPKGVEGMRETLLPKEAASVPPEKPACKKKPCPKVSTVEAGPTEEPREASEGYSEPDGGVGMASGRTEDTPAGERSRPPACTRPAARPASPKKEELLSEAGRLVHEDATSGDKPIAGSVSASNGPPSKPPLSEQPTFSEDRGPNTGHATHGRPASGGKPPSHPGNGTQALPTASAKSASQPGPGVHREPAPHKQPESAGKPLAKKPEPAEPTEKEAGDDSSTEAVEEEAEEDDGGDGREPDLGGGSEEGDGDAFDKELDYGLSESPFNSYEYHDAWSEEDSEEPEEGLEDGLSEDTAGLGDGEPVFDAWGDRVVARAPALLVS